MSASSDASAGNTSAAGGLLDPRPLEVLGIRGVAADEVDARPGRVLLEVREHDDLRVVVVALQLVDEVAGGRVPAADDDVVRVARRTQALALLEQEVDDERDERAGEGPDDRDPEEAEEPADDPADRARDVGRVALAEDRLDAPVERRAERPERQRLLDERDDRCGDQDEGERPEQELAEEPPVDAPRTRASASRGAGRPGC